MEVGSYVVKALFMKREIVLNGESIVYELMEKRIKNVNIRIRRGRNRNRFRARRAFCSKR